MQTFSLCPEKPVELVFDCGNHFWRLCELKETGVTSNIHPDSQATYSTSLNYVQGVNPICRDWGLERDKPLRFNSLVTIFGR